jgi:hypothetical protein
MAKTSFMFPISQAQKADMETWAAENDMSTASAIRLALAKLTGYDLSQEPPTERRKTYASPEERIKHQRAMNKAKRKRDAQVVRLMASGNTAEAMALAQQPLEPADYNPGVSTMKTGFPSMANDCANIEEADEDEDEGE